MSICLLIVFLFSLLNWVFLFSFSFPLSLSLSFSFFLFLFLFLLLFLSFFSHSLSSFPNNKTTHTQKTKTIGNLPNLKKLNVSNNLIRSIPESFLSTNLDLNSSNNPLSQVFSSFSFLFLLSLSPFSFSFSLFLSFSFSFSLPLSFLLLTNII